MSITSQQIQIAQRNQHAIAHDPLHEIRLISRSGAGNSHAIQERELWLLKQNIAPETYSSSVFKSFLIQS